MFERSSDLPKHAHCIQKPPHAPDYIRINDMNIVVSGMVWYSIDPGCRTEEVVGAGDEAFSRALCNIKYKRHNPIWASYIARARWFDLFAEWIFYFCFIALRVVAPLRPAPLCPDTGAECNFVTRYTVFCANVFSSPDWCRREWVTSVPNCNALIELDVGENKWEMRKHSGIPLQNKYLRNISKCFSRIQIKLINENL